jgi:hypothetical protein
LRAKARVSHKCHDAMARAIMMAQGRHQHFDGLDAWQ